MNNLDKKVYNKNVEYETSIKICVYLCFIKALFLLYPAFWNQSVTNLEAALTVIVLSIFCLKNFSKILVINLGLFLAIESIGDLFYAIQNNIILIVTIPLGLFCIYSGINAIKSSFKRDKIIHIKTNWKNFFIKCLVAFFICFIFHFCMYQIIPINKIGYFLKLVKILVTIGIYALCFTGKLSFLEKFKIHECIDNQ